MPASVSTVTQWVRRTTQWWRRTSARGGAVGAVGAAGAAGAGGGVGEVGHRSNIFGGMKNATLLVLVLAAACQARSPTRGTHGIDSLDFAELVPQDSADSAQHGQRLIG